MIKLKNMKLTDKINANLSEVLAGKLNMNQTYKQKLKELKTWAQVKSPKALQPALSYTLGWLSPELLGSGFRMTEISDFEIQALVPADSANLDQVGQIHQGLVLNASLELVRNFIVRHLPEAYFQIISSEIKINKQHQWAGDLKLNLVCDEAIMDQFFSDLQESKKASIHLIVQVEMKTSKKTDTVDLKLVCEATTLLA